MKPAFALLPLLFVFLFVVVTESKRDPEKYWKMVMKDQEMPKGIQGLLQLTSKNNPKVQDQLVEGSKHKCKESLITNAQVTTDLKVFTKDLDNKLGYKNEKTQVNGDFEPRPSVTKYDDFEPRPSVTKYNDDFEPRPSVTKYDDFEPRSSVTKYDDFKPKPSVIKYDDFEPRSSVTKYNDDFEPRSSVTKYNNFESRSSIIKYGDDFEPRSSVIKYDDFEPRPSVTNYND